MAGAATRWLRPPIRENSGIAAPSGRKQEKLPLTMRVVVAASLLLSVVEAIWFWPNYLAYFNWLDGGPRHAYRHLVDSSLDWSQNLKDVKAWLDMHPADSDPRRLYVSFYGSAPPEYYGIRATTLPCWPIRWRPHVPDPLTGGTYIISATMLQGVMLQYSGRWNQSYEHTYQDLRSRVEDFVIQSQSQDGRNELFGKMPEHAWYTIFWAYEMLRYSRLASFLREREPDEQIGYSILIYRLSDADVARALNGPPIELLDRPEVEQEEIRLGLE
jgi:hypothetical protein